MTIRLVIVYCEVYSVLFGFGSVASCSSASAGIGALDRVQLGPHVVGMRALVFDSAREGEIAARAINEVLGTAEDRRQNRCGCRQVDQL